MVFVNFSINIGILVSIASAKHKEVPTPIFDGELRENIHAYKYYLFWAYATLYVQFL